MSIQKLMRYWGIINQSQFVEKEENLNYDLIKESLKKELKEKRGY